MPDSPLIVRSNVANMHAEGTPPTRPYTLSLWAYRVPAGHTGNLSISCSSLYQPRIVVEGSSEVEITQVAASENPNFEEARPRASRAEYKSIDEVYVTLKSFDYADSNYFTAGTRRLPVT